MFTGIVQATARIAAIDERDGLRRLRLEFPAGFCQDLAIGASLSVDGVCLTVSERPAPDAAAFDVMQPSLLLTTLGGCAPGERVNVERAARDGAEIGGHPLSGHIDFAARLSALRVSENNLLWRLSAPPEQRKYIFAKGYIAVHGASLTVAEVDRTEGWFEVWLIPETRRATVFESKKAGDRLNVEIDRSTQVLVDTVREAVQESLGRLRPALDALLQDQGLALEDLLQLPERQRKP